MVRTMADEKRTNRPKAAKEKPQYTTFRLYADDGMNLSDLADFRNKTIADLYRELFSEEVRKMLIAETKQRLKKLEAIAWARAA